jgi:hypothetical protein
VEYSMKGIYDGILENRKDLERVYSKRIPKEYSIYYAYAGFDMEGNALSLVLGFKHGWPFMNYAQTYLEYVMGLPYFDSNGDRVIDEDYEIVTFNEFNRRPFLDQWYPRQLPNNDSWENLLAYFPSGIQHMVDGFLLQIKIAQFIITELDDTLDWVI